MDESREALPSPRGVGANVFLTPDWNYVRRKKKGRREEEEAVCEPADIGVSQGRSVPCSLCSPHSPSCLALLCKRSGGHRLLSCRHSPLKWSQIGLEHVPAVCPVG